MVCSNKISDIDYKVIDFRKKKKNSDRVNSGSDFMSRVSIE